MAGTPPTSGDDPSIPPHASAGPSGAVGASEGHAESGEVSQADIDALLNAVQLGEVEQAAKASKAASPKPAPRTRTDPVESKRFEFPDLGPPPSKSVDPKKITMLNDVKLRVKVELGRTRMLVEDVLELGEGSVVELDKLAGDPVDVYANDRLVARGEVLVLNDTFCVRVSEVVTNDPHRVTA